MPQIKVSINNDGSKVEMEVEGVKGGSCKDITTQLQAALGGASDEKLTSEFYETPDLVGVNINGG